MRATIEAEKYSQNCFLTLTYADKYLPENGVEKREVQLFIKRLRKYISKTDPYRKIKYLAVGEYGEQLHRPHYHILIFNYDFEDKKFFKKTKKGENIYYSLTLDNLWQKGLSSIGALTHASASYTAGYIHKKVNGNLLHYSDQNGQLVNQEFNLVSQGIAKDFFLDNTEQLFNHDYIVYQGRKFPLFEYYNRLLTKSEKFDYNILKQRRLKHIKEMSPEDCKTADYILKQKFAKRSQNGIS